MLKLYCFLTGEDYQMLKNETPGSKKKVALLATCLLVPSFLWFLNGFLIVNQVLDGSLKAAIITAFVVAFIIFFIERIIIMSPNNKKIFVFRMMLGVCIAFIGSIALDEVIFKNDINHQVEENYQTIKDNLLNKTTQTTQKNLESQNILVNQKYIEWKLGLDEVQREADGTGGSHIRGVNGITKIKLENAKLKENDYNKANNELAILKNKMEARQNKNLSDLENSFNSHSLLIRIKAMFDLIMKNTGMLIVYCVFTVILFMCEFLVVFIKMCSKESNYERKVKLIEEIGKERMNKIANKDSASFDPGTFQTNVKQAKVILQKQYPSVFRN